MRVPDWTNVYSIESSGPVMRTSRPVSSATSRRPSPRASRCAFGVPLGRVQVRRRVRGDDYRRRVGSVRPRTGRRCRPRTWRSQSSGVPRRRGGAGTATRSGAPGPSPVHRHGGPDAADRATVRSRGSRATPARAQAGVRTSTGPRSSVCAAPTGGERRRRPETEPPLSGAARRTHETGRRTSRVLGGDAVSHGPQWY